MKTIKSILLTSALLVLLSACDMMREPEKADEGKATVSIWVGGMERSVLPQVTLDDVDHYALWGAPAETLEGETVLIPSFTQGASTSVNAGTWNFTVKGYNGEDALILEGKLTNQVVSRWAANSFTFSLSPLLEGTGSIAITIILPSGSGVTTAAVFKDGEGEASLLTPVDDRITYNAESVPAGDYFYSFRLHNSQGDTIAVVSETVQVRASLWSEKTIELTQADLNALPGTPASPLIEAGDGQLTVRWAAVPMIGDYEVYYDVVLTPLTEPAQIVSNTTEAVISGLTNGVTYYVWIKAANAAGTSDYSPAASGTPLTLPAAPEKPIVTIGDSQLMVIWNTVPWVDSYEVYYSTDGTAPDIPGENVVINGTGAVITGLANGTTYYVWIKAKNAAGSSPYSERASGTPLAILITTENSRLTLTWQTVPGAEYEVYYSETGAPPDPAVTPSNVTIRGTTIITATIADLTNSVTYFIWIQAKDAAGAPLLSVLVSGTPGLLPPVNLQASTQSAERILISWDAPAITGFSYRVYRSDSSGGTYTLAGTSPTLSYLDAGLSGDTTYWYKVSTVKGSESALSASVSATTQVEAFITITLQSLEDVDISTQSAAIPRGQSRTFQVTGNYTSYQWYLNGAAITGAADASYTLNTASLSLGVYELAVIVNAGTDAPLSGNCYVGVEQ
jgi:fibronectin type 3 domain-containing protein